MMRANAATIEALLNATDDSVVLLDLEGRFLAINQEGANRRGLTADELIGKSLFEYIDPAVAAQRKANIQKAIATKKPVYDDETVNDKYYRVSVYPVINEDGEVIQVASYSRDRTENRNYELQLIKSMELAEAANLAKTQFLCNMSHEIRTPLTAILGISQIALDETQEGATRGNLEIIHDSGLRLLNLLNNLLDLAATEQRAIEPNIQPFDLLDLLSSLQKSFAIQAERNHTSLVIDIDPTLPLLLSGDEYRLRQILCNLLSNAIRATHNGVVTLNVTAYIDDHQNKHMAEVHFTIDDNGIGLDEERMPFLFEKFNISEDVWTKKHSGAGIGLSLTKNLVEMLGGEIVARSKKQQGTSIAFHLPLGIHNPKILHDARSLDQHADGKHCAMLILDDDAVRRAGVTKILTTLGFTVKQAHNGFEALQVLRSHPIDLMLMESKMPHMDGVQTSVQIKRNGHPGALRTIPVLGIETVLNYAEKDMFWPAEIEALLCRGLQESAW